MDLDAYFARIDYRASPRVDLATLRAVHHQHLLHIPYENIDVQLGTPLDFDAQRIFDKLVTRGRGGWCYEMNGLLAWALDAIGFKVRRMSGAVMRERQGDQQLGNHLVLEVVFDGQTLIADVGLGDGLREPIPLAAGSYRQAFLEYRLELLEDGFWRFHNQPYSNAASFDFRHAAADEGELAAKCEWLQTDPESPFRQLLIAQRFTDNRIHSQLGRIATTVARKGKVSKTLATAADLQTRLLEVFGLDVDITPLWPAICDTHARYFEDKPAP